MSVMTVDKPHKARSKAKVIPLRQREETYGERDPDSVRCFRIWDSKAREWRRWRCYSIEDHAHNGALIEIAYYSPVGTTLEVIDVRTMREIGTYKRRADGDIEFSAPKRSHDREA